MTRVAPLLLLTTMAGLAGISVVSADRNDVQRGVAPTGAGEAAEGDSTRAADRAAILAASAEFARAFEKGDAAAAARHWTDQGEYHSDTGETIRGRAALESAFAAHFKDHPKGVMDADVRSIRFPSRDTAIDDGVLRFRPNGPLLPRSTRYSTLHVREDGRWKIAVSREWAAGEDHLDDLAWLIGVWSARVDGAEVKSEFTWSHNKALIQNQFSRQEAGKPTVTGVQMIGLDPMTGRLRSWTFDNQGGRGEGLWHRDGNRWVVESVGAAPGREENRSANVLNRINDDTITWRSTYRTAGGADLPDAAPVRLTRVRPAR